MNFNVVKFPYSTIELNSGLSIISIVSPVEFFSYANGLKNDNEDIVLSSEDKILNVEKYIYFFGDVVNSEDLNHIYSKEIYKLIIKYFDEDNIAKINQISSEFNSVLSEVVLKNNLPISFNLDFEIENFIKRKDLTIDVPIVKNPYDKIQNIIDVASEFNDERLLVFTNSYQYLTSDQVDYLARDIRLKELKVLFLERSNSKLTSNEAVNVQFIDDDFIQI